MPRHAKPTPPRRRSPHLALAGAAVAAAVLFGGSATAAAIVPAGVEEETTLLECKTIEKPGSSTSSSTHVQDKPSAAPSKPSPAPGKPPLDAAPTTTAPAETPTEPSTPPAQGEGTTAAEVHGWGTPIAAASDDFDGTSLDTGKWSVYDGPGHDGNGTRSPSQVTVEDGKLVLFGDEAGNSAGMASTFDQQYGRWEARVRSEGAGDGNPYHPLLIVWPESNQWPDHGEYDFYENTEPGADYVQAFMHYPGHTPKRQEHARLDGVDGTQWQNIALEWTPDHLKGYVNGEEWFSFGEHDITGMPSGHLTIQLDNFHGAGMQPARYEIDWVNTYAR